jgi:hypothetical protein
MVGVETKKKERKFGQMAGFYMALARARKQRGAER